MSAPVILFGGTFDPVHRAHISCARAAAKVFATTVQLLPNAQPPHRDQPQTNAEHRLAMLEIACAPFAELAVNTWELQQTGPSFMVRTLEHFRAEAGQRPLLLLIGADSLATLDSWHQWRQLPALCHLLVVPRAGASPLPAEVVNVFPEGDADILKTTPSGRRLMLGAPNLDVSATAIRHALADKGECAALNSDVQDYIHRHHLYNLPTHTPNNEIS